MVSKGNSTQDLGHFSQVPHFVGRNDQRPIYSASMNNNSNNVILRALLNALRPLARLLMKAGIGYREFAELSKCAFVDVATTDYGISPPNSIQTALVALRTFIATGG